MPISKTPPLEGMPAADREIYERLEDVATEHIGPGQSSIAATAADLVPHHEFRYETVQIVGLPKPLRFRSLTLGEFRNVTKGELDELLLVMSAIVDENGHNYATEADLAAMQEADPRTWAHVLTVCIKHCLGGTLEQLTEEAEKN